jgi:hypothetical protein
MHSGFGPGVVGVLVFASGYGDHLAIPLAGSLEHVVRPMILGVSNAFSEHESCFH